LKFQVGVFGEKLTGGSLIDYFVTYFGYDISNKVGLFASRSPNRPNPIGISVVKIKRISGNILYISGIDAFDNTPVLDIKPYFDQLDAKTDANTGWFNPEDDSDHFLLHLKGIPHQHK